MVKPIISVIIPMYNSGKTAINAVKSVIFQTYADPIEIIIVNDGSIDDSQAKIENFLLEKYPNRTIRLINKLNGGVSSARNAGIEVAEGEWLAFLDSDDIWLPEKLEEQFRVIMQNSEIKLLGANRRGELYPFLGKAKERIFCLSAKEIILKWYPHTSTVLIHRSVLKESGVYDIMRTHAEDGDLFVRIALICDLYVLNEELVYTGSGKRSFGESGLSANLAKMFNGEIHIIKQALKRKQINPFEFTFFGSWLSAKYFRRIAITKIAKLSKWLRGNNN